MESVKEMTAPELEEYRLTLVLNGFAADEYTSHRIQAASHPKTPLETLKALVADPSGEVALKASQNPVYRAFRQQVGVELGLSEDLPEEWREKLIDVELQERSLQESE